MSGFPGRPAPNIGTRVMAIIEYKTDGSYREFENHFKRKTKDDLIRELWDAFGKQTSIELMMAVESKYQGESRHETALRYIQEREAHLAIESQAVLV